MTTLIRDRALADDSWRLLPQEEASAGVVPQSGDLIVPLSLWLAQRSGLDARTGKTGVWLQPADDPGELAKAPPLPDLVAVQFPVFHDGRGYSTARLLRERYGFRGELRAMGDILRDQLFELSRCGFDAFALRADQDAEAALRAFNDFSEVYQAAVDRGPLFDRRFALRRGGVA